MPSEYLLLESGDHLLLESADDLLLESTTVDQSIALPLIDDSTIYGPTLGAVGVIDLPLIDDAGTQPPDVFEDKTIDLSLLDGSAVYGPSVSGALELPLIDGSSTFGPDVSIVLFLGLPLIDDAVLFGPTISHDESLDLPLIDGGWPYPPAVVGAAVSGLEVLVGSASLDESFARWFLDELSDTGSFRVSVANDDPDAPDFDDVVRYRIDGRDVFAGLVEGRHVTTHARGEEDDEVTVCSGRGTLALLDFGTVEPARGLDALPIELVRSFSWVSSDYDLTWPNAKNTLHPSHGYPEWWPDQDPSCWWVWANRPDVSASSAPGGRCLFRSTFTLAEDATLRIFMAPDNRGTWWFDGAQISDLDDAAYRSTQYVEIDATAGEHLIAASVLNTGRHGGMIFTIYTVDSEGLLDEVVHRSNASTVDCLAYPYPDRMPGFSPGKAIRLMIEEAQARGELLGVTLGFNDYFDSDGELWSEPAEITVDVGKSVLEAVLAMADWLIDVQMAPGANVLRAWNHGTRGRTPGVTIAATTDPDTSEVEGLAHDGRLKRATRLLIRYRTGWTEVGSEGRTAFVDLGHVETETAAKRIGNKLLQFRNVEAYARTLSLAPVSSQPYDAFDNGDTISHPDEAGGTAASRVRSLTFSEDDGGEHDWAVALNDVRRELAERFDNQLKIAAAGTLAGGGRVMSRSGDSIGSVVRVATKDVVEFSSDTPTVGLARASRTADTSGNLIDIFLEVTPETEGLLPSSATTVTVYMDGSTLGTVTVAAGALNNTVTLNAEKVHRNVTRFRPEVLAVGSGVAALGVQVRAI